MIFALAVPLLSAASSLASTPPGGKLERGKLLYLLGCVGCHGDEGTGDGPDGAIFDPPPTDLRRMLRRVRPDMPHFESTLTTDDVKAILSYLRSLPSLSPRAQRENIRFRVPFLYAAPECGPKSPAVGDKNDFARGACEPRYFRFKVSVLD